MGRRALTFITAVLTLSLGFGVLRARAEDLGEKLYQANCASCHGAKLTGSGFGPAVSGKAFQDKWRPLGPSVLYAFIRTRMPPGRPDTLDPAAYAEVTDYIAKHNGLPPTPDDAVAKRSSELNFPMMMMTMKIVSANFDEIYHRVMQQRRALLERLTPVTDQLLAAPPAQDWPAWRRSLATLGFSPLKGIDRDNAKRLTLVWSGALPPGVGPVAPLVHDGVMFLHAGERAMALDAATGDVLWERRIGATARPQLPQGQPRSISLYGDAVYLSTIDGRVLALDARTGDVRWETPVFDPAKDKVQITAGPLVANGKVFQGVSGCQAIDQPGGCFLVALDAATGKRLWRFDTIARPGQAGGNSWNGAPLEKRFGGSIWTPPTYDPDTGLLYVGIGQTYHPLVLLSPKEPDKRADALYTDSTVALNPQTGALVWHYQHVSGDIWDLDWSFERSLVNVGGRKAVLTGGKIAIFDLIDARSGAYIDSVDFGVQTLVAKIDPKTGRKTINPAAMLHKDKASEVCPAAIGGRNWLSTAYDPERGVLFVPMLESCMRMSLAWDMSGELADSTGGAGMSFGPRPGNDGLVGRLAAMDMATKKLLWVDRRRAPPASATLATAGGLLFAGDEDHVFRALDAKTGEVLWSTRLAHPVAGFPIAYSVGDREYVAVITSSHTPFESTSAIFVPEIADAGAGRSVWVFAVGDRTPSENGLR